MGAYFLFLLTSGSLLFLQSIFLPQWHWTNLILGFNLCLNALSFSAGHTKSNHVSQIRQEEHRHTPLWSNACFILIAIINHQPLHSRFPSSKPSIALLLPTSFVLFNLTPPHASFHRSFQPLALLPSSPPPLTSYFLLCQSLYLKQNLTFKTTKSSKKFPFWSILHWFPTLTIFYLLKFVSQNIYCGVFWLLWSWCLL